MAVLIEFLVSAIIGIYFHWVLKYEEAAYIIFGSGALLSLATYLVREEVAHTRQSLLDRFQSTNEIPSVLSKIKAPECQIKAQELLSALRKNLELLQHGYVPLKEIEFYLESAKALEQSITQAKAVDLLRIEWDSFFGVTVCPWPSAKTEDSLKAVWNSRGALQNYYEANTRALARGVRITRIFVVGGRELNDPQIQNVLQTQLKAGIDVRVVCKEDIPKNSGDYDNWSFDFAVYDGRVVSDRGGEGSSFFGRKTSLSTEVEKYIRLFDLIEHHSHRIAINWESA